MLEDATTVQEFALGGDPGQFDSIDMTGMAGEDVNIQDILNQSGYESVDDLGSLFDDAKLKPTKDEQMPEVQILEFLVKFLCGQYRMLTSLKCLFKNLLKVKKVILKTLKRNLAIQLLIRQKRLSQLLLRP